MRDIHDACVVDDEPARVPEARVRPDVIHVPSYSITRYRRDDSQAIYLPYLEVEAIGNKDISVCVKSETSGVMKASLRSDTIDAAHCPRCSATGEDKRGGCRENDASNPVRVELDDVENSTRTEERESVRRVQQPSRADAVSEARSRPARPAADKSRHGRTGEIDGADPMIVHLCNKKGQLVFAERDAAGKIEARVRSNAVRCPGDTVARHGRHRE